MDWLLRNAPGFSELTEEERQALGEFSLLWSLFEARVMDTRAGAKKIYAVVRDWNAAGTLDHMAYNPELAYFRHRYFVDHDHEYHLEQLHLQNANRPGLVLAVLDGSNVGPCETIGVLHTVVFSLRNNLFHGVKWQYRLRGQLDNFRNASSALVKSLERHGNLGGVD